jgi:hypothetical protein
MTIFGKHTVSEVQALGKDLDYQFNQVNEAFKSIDPKWIQSNPEKYERLTKAWTAAKRKWSNDSLNVKGSIAIKMGAAGIMVSPTVVPAEDEFQLLLSNTPQGGANGEGTLYDTNLAIQEIRNTKTDFQNRPNQVEASGTDWDFKAFQKVDGAIRKGESAVKEAAKNNKGLLVAGGVGLVIAGVFVGKAYL